MKDVAKMKTLYIVQRAALSSCHVQHVLLTVAVELPHEIPYSLPNAIDVADPPALILLHISSTFGIDHIKSISGDDHMIMMAGYFRKFCV